MEQQRRRIGSERDWSLKFRTLSETFGDSSTVRRLPIDIVPVRNARECQTLSAQYTAQVSMYARAVAAATNSPARGILLVI